MKRACVVLALVFAPAIAAAQSPTPASLLADWERSRQNVLAYIDAMPDSATGFRPTPGVRTFAEQFDHFLTTNYEVAAIALKGLKQPPAGPDSARYLHNKAALRAYAVMTYDYAIGALRAATPQALNQMSSVYGQPPAPAARWMQLSLEHAVWTMGQLVPYLRLNGVTPPAYGLPL